MTDPESHYDKWFNKLTEGGISQQQAAVAVIHRYLDGKPTEGISPAERDAALWTSGFWKVCPDESIRTECFALALAKYFGRDGTYTFSEMNRALRVAPDACTRAIRYSRVFLNPQSARWMKLQGVLAHEAKGYRGFVEKCRDLWRRYEQLRRNADNAYLRLADVPLLDLLVMASVSAFKTELPPFLRLASPNPVVPHPEFRYPLFTEAVSRLLARRVRQCSEEERIVTEEKLRVCFQRRVYPLLLRHYADEGKCAEDLSRFESYIDAQVRLDAFRQSEIIAFCFDHGPESFSGNNTTDSAIQPQNSFKPWVISQIRGQVLGRYWQAVGETLADENAHDDIEVARIDRSLSPLAGTLRDLAMLHDLYGVDDAVELAKNRKIRLDQACLALEMARHHYQSTLLIPYAAAYKRLGNWAEALVDVIDAGIFDGLQQRYPVLFARHDEKLQLLRQFTTTEQQPQGSDEAASALLTFWANELTTSLDPIHQDMHQLRGSLAELPFLKLGDYVFTLPWVLTTQDICTAVINNLRRIRRQRPDARQETFRSEQRLAHQMEAKGFRTVVGFEPADGDGDGEPPGEIDLIASRDGHIFVLEIKTGYIRQTFEASWHHRTHTLRKAGRQLARKLRTLAQDFPEELQHRVGLSSLPSPDKTHAWIVDTSPDFDREEFSGFTKVCMTEVLIALRDEVAFLAEDDTFETLYPQGFSAGAFAEVISRDVIWQSIETGTQ